MLLIELAPKSGISHFHASPDVLRALLFYTERSLISVTLYIVLLLCFAAV